LCCVVLCCVVLCCVVLCCVVVMWSGSVVVWAGWWYGGGVVAVEACHEQNHAAEAQFDLTS
jgi:hypothetical protein